MRDRFGAATMRQSSGWGPPGIFPFGVWDRMWVARGPYEQCGPWGVPLVLCDDRGPRIGNEGQPRCRLHKHHDGQHTSALSDGWNPVITWSELAPKEKNMRDVNMPLLQAIEEYLERELPGITPREAIAKDIASVVTAPLVKQPGSDPALDLLILEEEIIELQGQLGRLGNQLAEKRRRAQDLRTAIDTLQNYGYKV
jgi:hypothetical protein